MKICIFISITKISFCFVFLHYFFKPTINATKYYGIIKAGNL